MLIVNARYNWWALLLTYSYKCAVMIPVFLLTSLTKLKKKLGLAVFTRVMNALLWGIFHWCMGTNFWMHWSSIYKSLLTSFSLCTNDALKTYWDLLKYDFDYFLPKIYSKNLNFENKEYIWVISLSHFILLPLLF